MTEHIATMLGLLLATARCVCPLDVGILPFLPAGELPETLTAPDIAAFDGRFLEACRLHDVLRCVSYSPIEPEPRGGVNRVTGESARSSEALYLASVLDARRVAALYDFGLIVYGRIAAREDLIDVEVSLYDRELGKSRRKFYSRTSPEDLAEAADDLARRCVDFIYETNGMSDMAAERVRERGGIILSVGGGSWIVGGRWAEALSGVIACTFGIRLVPHSPYRLTAHSLTYLRFGGDLQYQFGTNAPGAITSRSHIAELALPIEFCIEADPHSLLLFGVDAGVHTTFCWYEVPHDAAGFAVTSVPAVSGTVGYEYWFREDRQFSLGASVTAGVVLFDPALLRITAGIYSSIRIQPDVGKGGYRGK